MADEVVVPGTTEVAAPESTAVVGPRGLRGPRLVLVVAGVAVLCLVVGLLAGRFVVSPAQAAADAAPPQAGPIVAPVEQRVLSNDVVLRADAVFADAVEVRLETGEISGPAVVTGQVPEVGTQLDPASVLLEIAGRPVIVLPGELPVYRSLRVGTSGPDVLQYKAALAALGIDAGDVNSDVYDARAAAGTDALYAKAGYPSPEAPEEAQGALTAARENVRAARSAVQDAEVAMAAAGNGPGDVEKLAADNVVRAAERQLAQAEQDAAAQAAAKAAAQDSETPLPPEADLPVDVAGAQDALNLARAERAALDAPRDTSAERSMLDAAREALADAQEELADAQEQVLTALPASEIVYVAGLPRRVDETYVERGGLINGAVAAVSGATLMLEAAVSASDADLLEPGVVGELELSDGTAVTAAVLTIGEDTAASGGPGPGSGDGEGDAGAGSQGPTSSRVAVTLEPKDLTPEQVELLRGENVRVKIEVGATDGEVLTVPIAALTAGSGGESRIEVVRDGGQGDSATELVEVTTGLAAEGFVEIVSVEGELAAGDEVVVGR